VLEDLGAGGIDGTDKDWVKPMIDMGYWPPQTGPRIKGFETATPKLICVPFIGDIQTFTYRNDVYTGGAPKTWDEVIEKGKAGVAGGKIKYPVVFDGASGNPIVTTWHPLLMSFGGDFFDDKWNIIFNSEAGKAAADFMVTTLKQNAPPGVVEFQSDQQGASMLGGDSGATIQYTGNALVSDDPAQSKEVGKLDFSVVPKKEKAIAQIGIFIAGVPKTAPNKANAIEFLKWFVTPEIQAKLSAAGAIPVKRTAFTVPPAGNRLIPVTLAQFDAGAMPRPRTPDWAKIEELVGIQLNRALQAGSGGGAALDVAAGQIKDYLTQAGYYK
jgi:multiple sugar transport system substrate-binding protein